MQVQPIDVDKLSEPKTPFPSNSGALESKLTQIAASSLIQLMKAGYDVHATDDFDEVERLFPLTGKDAQKPIMDVTRQDFTRRDAFFLFVLKGDQVIGGLGAKIIDLSGESFGSFIQRTIRNQYQFGSDPVRYVAAPAEEALKNKLIYFGELSFRDDFRAGVPLASVAWFLKSLAVMRWSDFNAMFSFIAEEHKFLARHYNFSLSIESAISWITPPPGWSDTNWILTSNRSQFEHSVNVSKLRAVDRIQGLLADHLESGLET